MRASKFKAHKNIKDKKVCELGERGRGKRPNGRKKILSSPIPLLTRSN